MWVQSRSEIQREELLESLLHSWVSIFVLVRIFINLKIKSGRTSRRKIFQFVYLQWKHQKRDRVTWK